MTRLLLLRHAESTWNAENRWQGWSDPLLTAAGRQAANAWSMSPPATFQAVVSSDLARARDTAIIIAWQLGLAPVRACFGLREQDQGAWTGLTKSQIKQRWPERLREHPRRPVAGESPGRVRRRVQAALAQLCRDYSGQSVLVVTHAGVIREIERSVVCDRLPVPHLEGRWIEAIQPAPGSSVYECALGQPTPGRHTPVSHAGAKVGEERSFGREGLST